MEKIVMAPNAVSRPAPIIYDAQTVGRLLNMQYGEIEPFLFSKLPVPLYGHLTFFDPGWSILQLRGAVERKGAIFYPSPWYDTELFAKTGSPPRYRQLRMEPVKGSFRKTFAEQEALLAASDEVPAARVVAMGTVIHFLATQQQLFKFCYVRCADHESCGYRVYVGFFDSRGFIVNRYWDGYRYAFLGLASSRKC